MYLASSWLACPCTRESLELWLSALRLARRPGGAWTTATRWPRTHSSLFPHHGIASSERQIALTLTVPGRTRPSVSTGHTHTRVPITQARHARPSWHDSASRWY
eukprot:1817134-Rhodomonas_salina.7